MKQARLKQANEVTPTSKDAYLINLALKNVKMAGAPAPNSFAQYKAEKAAGGANTDIPYSDWKSLN